MIVLEKGMDNGCWQRPWLNCQRVGYRSGVTGSGPVNCCVSFPSSFFTMYSSLLVFSWYHHGAETISISDIAVLCQQNSFDVTTYLV